MATGGRALTHAFVVGELAKGSFRPTVLSLSLPNNPLHATLDAPARLWTRDRRPRLVANELKISASGLA